ncbi:hypothetical protein DEO72_LG11g2207 [Vigna unguiculata]|uniref:Uncharacterized protein n=1 Tax=Vigna unguiculata TaxID=3917 RepID=A0A4D6NPF8_VIGUN|nr:hypothetical protein DEO72_LG11g2207 [Vigna unguiculata]
MFAWWWRDVETLAERQRERPLPEQHGRRRDDTAAGGWRRFLAGSHGERGRDSGGSRARVVFSTGWQWWRSEMEEEQRVVAGIAERNGGAARARKKGAAVLSPN